MSVFFYYGDEDYNIEQAVNEHKKSLDKNFSAMNYQVYDNPKFVDLISVLRTTPMMFGKMLIVINCLNYFSSSFEEAQNKQLEEALSLVSDDVDIVFVAALPRNQNKKLNTGKKLFKILSQYTVQEYKTIPSYKINDIVFWINKYAKNIGVKIENNASFALVEQIGNNLREFANELEKLKLAVHPQKVITIDDIRKNCITNEDLFNFTNYIMTNELDKALLEFRKVLLKKHELEILSALQTMLRKWILIKLNRKKGLSVLEISTIVGQHKVVVEKNIESMKNHSLRDLVNLKQKLSDVEYKIKSGQTTDSVGEIENAIIR